jgi:hypothetical protein
MFGMPELSPFFSAAWVGTLLLVVLGAAWNRRSRQVHRRSYSLLSERLGLELEASRLAVSGLLAGRQVRAWYEPEPRSNGLGSTLVRVDLLGVLGAEEPLDAAQLEAWAQQAVLGAAWLTPEARARLEALSPRVWALLEEPRVQALLRASLKTLDGAWIERGQLHLRRRGRPRHASVLEALLEEALALAVALSSATHAPAPQRERTG